ncbi:MAG: GNAT family N-acetyltransferase [Lachnospiraceae bacterium]|nr:GNAT family N-acetyltransferase [Lachnospiraceae bacterium]
MKREYGVGDDIKVYVCDTQEDIDDCIAANVPVIGYDPEDRGLSCSEILLDFAGIEDDYLTRVHHRFYGIPMEILTTERLRVRELELRDLPELFMMYDDPEMTRFVEPLFAYEEELEYEKNYIQYVYGLYGYGMWLVFERESGALVGRAGVESKEEWPEDTVEMGYLIAKPYWGRGYATEVCGAIMRYAHETLGKKRVVCRVDSRNRASVGLMQKLGFKKLQLNGEKQEDVWSDAY